MDYKNGDLCPLCSKGHLYLKNRNHILRYKGVSRKMIYKVYCCSENEDDVFISKETLEEIENVWQEIERNKK